MVGRILCLVSEVVVEGAGIVGEARESCSNIGGDACSMLGLIVKWAVCDDLLLWWVVCEDLVV